MRFAPLLAALLCLGPPPARAQAEDALPAARPADGVEAAASAGALALLKDATARIQAGGLDEDGLVGAWAEKARAYARLDDLEKAKRAFRVVLRLDPSFRLQDVDEPSVRAAFTAALAHLPPPHRALAAVATRRAGSPSTVEVRLLADDLSLVAGARTPAGAVAALSDASPSATVEHEGPIASIVLVDKYGNAVRALEVVDVDPAPPSASGPPRGSTWLSLVGAGSIGLGAAGVVASGMGYAWAGADAGASDDQRALLLAGTGISTGVILLGGGFLVADLLLGGG